MIQSGPGTVRNCVFARQGSAIELNSVMPYVEGGVPRGITITSNVFTEVNPVPHGAAISVYSRTFGSGGSTLSDITIVGNHFLRPGEAAIALTQVKGGVIASNRFSGPLAATVLARPAEPRHAQAVWLSRCADFRVEGNTLEDEGDYSRRDPTTGSPVVGCDNQCEGITVLGNVHLTR